MTTPVTPDSVHAGEKPGRYVALLFIVSTVSLMDRQILAILDFSERDVGFWGCIVQRERAFGGSAR